MANIRYLLFGQEFTESQGKMMARVFRTLLSRHPEKTEEALEQFSCLSAIDYTEDLPALGSAPSAFLNTKTFVINGQKISIGTSYGFRQKQAYIKRLFLLCQEDFGQFRILTGNASDAGAEVMVTACLLYTSPSPRDCS